MEIIEFKGMQLQINKDSVTESPWVEAWYELPNGNCIVEKFLVLDSGRPTYTLINEALEFFGRQILNAQFHSLLMSPGFAGRYLYPAIIQHHHQARWN